MMYQCQCGQSLPLVQCRQGFFIELYDPGDLAKLLKATKFISLSSQWCICASVDSEARVQTKLFHDPGDLAR